MTSKKQQSPGPQSASEPDLETLLETSLSATVKRAPDSRFRLAFESAPLGMAIIDLDHKLRRVNKALCEALGYSEAELLSKDLIGITHPADFNKDKKLADELRSGKITSYRVEKRLTTKGGGPAWLDVTVVLIRDERNEPQYALAMVDNITERKRAEEALRTSEERYRSFVVNSSEGIWRFEIEHPIEITLPVDEQIALFYKHAYLAECNDAMARMYGHERAEDLVGSRFGELALASNPTNISALRKFISSGYRLAEVETIELALDGSTRYIANHAIGIVINGVLLRIWGTQRDETERRQAEEELKVSRSQLRSLAGRLQSIREQERSHIARELHDVLGQSLTSLKLELSWLKKRLAQADEVSPVPVQKRLNEMMREVDNTINLVKFLSTELRPGILDKLGLAAAVEWQCQEFENRTGIKCNCKVPKEEISVSNERSTAVFRIMQEALTNVTVHSQATEVRVELELGKSSLKLSLSDNGRGITGAEISDPSSLGLLGMRERAELLGGHFAIGSTPESGTTVVAHVPLVDTAPAKAMETADVESATSRRSSGRAQGR